MERDLSTSFISIVCSRSFKTKLIILRYLLSNVITYNLLLPSRKYNQRERKGKLIKHERIAIPIFLSWFFSEYYCLCQFLHRIIVQTVSLSFQDVFISCYRKIRVFLLILIPSSKQNSFLQTGKINDCRRFNNITS